MIPKFLRGTIAFTPSTFNKGIPNCLFSWIKLNIHYFSLIIYHLAFNLLQIRSLFRWRWNLHCNVGETFTAPSDSRNVVALYGQKVWIFFRTFFHYFSSFFCPELAEGLSSSTTSPSMGASLSFFPGFLSWLSAFGFSLSAESAFADSYILAPIGMILSLRSLAAFSSSSLSVASRWVLASSTASCKVLASSSLSLSLYSVFIFSAW